MSYLGNDDAGRGALLRRIPRPRQTQSIPTLIYVYLRDLVVGGYVRRGSRLPSSRALAQDLGVSRNSVLAAFERLIAEDIVEVRRGQGCFVAAGMHVGNRSSTRPDGHLKRSRRSDASDSGLFKVPAVNHFPLQAWRRAEIAATKALAHADLALADDCYLRDALVGHLAVARGVRCSPEQIFVFASPRDAVAAVYYLLTDPGDPVSTFDAQLARDLGVEPITDEPITAVGDDRTKWSAAKLIHCSASFMPPAGRAMTLQARRQLLARSREDHAWVLEDDRFADFVSSNGQSAALHTLDGDERVVYHGTFADSLFPLEVSYLVAPPHLARALQAKPRRSRVPVTTQRALAELLMNGGFSAHLRRLRRFYETRRREVVSVLEKAGVEFSVDQDASGLAQAAFFVAGTAEIEKVQVALCNSGFSVEALASTARTSTCGVVVDLSQESPPFVPARRAKCVGAQKVA